MKLGRAINEGMWQMAGMTVTRMQKEAKEAEVTDFDRNLIMIKQCIMGRKKTEAQNALATVINKRVAMINSMSEEKNNG